MSDVTGDGDASVRLIAGVIKSAMRDAARGDEAAKLFLDEVLPDTTSAKVSMNDWIRAAAGRRQERTARRAEANAGNTGAPAVKQSTAQQMNAAIRAASGRKG